MATVGASRSPGPRMAAVEAWPVPSALIGRREAFLVFWALSDRRGKGPVC